MYLLVVYSVPSADVCTVESNDLVEYEYEYAIGFLDCIVVQTQPLVVEGVVVGVATVSFRNEQNKL